MTAETARVVTLVIALLALLLSVASLVWQVLMWRYTGSFVRVDNHAKFVVLPEGPPFGYLVAVVARNVGRTPVTVTAVSFKLRSGVSLMTLLPEYWQGPAVPHRLEPGDEVRWFAQHEKLLDGITGKPDEAEIVGEVFLATGKKAVAGGRLRPTWLSIDRSQPEDG